MAINPKQLGDENLRQLSLDLAIEEVEVDESISPEEAKRRSEVARVALKELLTKKSTIQWADDYYRLLDCGWSWRVAAYIAWAASPRSTRSPKTQEELALNVLGLTSDRQISTWRRKHSAIDETIGLMQAAPLLDHRRDVLQALAESAADSSFHGAQDRKTFLTITGDYVPHMKLETEREKVDPLEMSDAELAEVERRRNKDES